METPVSDSVPPGNAPAGSPDPGDEGGATQQEHTADRDETEGRPSARRQVLEWAGLLGGALLTALLIRAFLFQPFYIPTASMYPTLKVNDRVLVNKVSYKLHDVHRGDIIVFAAPEGEVDNGIKDLIKRVVGLPGEKIAGHDGHVYINGRMLDESYLPDGVTTADFEREKIPANSYWMMGDNRSQSRDSRYFGPIPYSGIVGRAFVRLWPLSRLGFL